MKYYVIMNKHELTSDVIEKSGYVNSQPIYIGDNYVLVSVKQSNLNELKGYIKYTNDEINDIIADIEEGKKVNTRLVLSEKQSVWADPEGARARYQSIGMIETDETKSVYWTADRDYYIDGLRFYIEGAEFGDSVDFEVHHPVYGIIDSFVKDWYIWDGSFKEDTYAAKLLGGLQIKITINKGIGNGGLVKCVFNAKLHAVD